MDTTGPAINEADRSLAALTHLSGLAGYVIPLGGILVPIIIWATKKDSPIISTIAKQAIVLNVVVFVLFAASAILWLTIILIPVVLLFWCALFIVALALPIVGAVKANDGVYYRYPVVGMTPEA
jgi:uncharacterized Tic20 family protein